MTIFFTAALPASYGRNAQSEDKKVILFKQLAGIAA